MPLTGTDAAMGALIFTMVQAELTKTGAPPDPSSVGHLKAFCNGIAKGVTQHLLLQGQVAPGIPTAGSPAAQVTVGPGKFL